MPTYYVKWDATGTPIDGTTWDKAYRTIAAAILARTATGDIVEVSGGLDGHTYNETLDYRYGGAAQLIGSSQAGHNGRVEITNAGINNRTLNITNKTIKNLDLLNEFAGQQALTSQGGTLESVNFPSGLRAFLHNSGTTLFDKCVIENQSDAARTGTVMAGTVTLQRSVLRKCASDIQVENGATLNIKRSDIVENYGGRSVNLAATAVVNIDSTAISGNGKWDVDSPTIKNGSGGTLNVTDSLLQPHFRYNTPCCSNMTVNTGNVTSAPHFASHGGGKAYISFGADCDCRSLGTGGHLPGEGTWEAFQALIDYANPKGIYCYVAMERSHLYTEADWDRIRAWEAAGNEAHNHTFHHLGMADVLDVGVLAITGPANSTITLSTNRVDETDSTTWTGALLLKVGGATVATIDISSGTEAGTGQMQLKAAVGAVSGWSAAVPSGVDEMYAGPTTCIKDVTDVAAASGITLKFDIDKYLWVEYVESKLLVERELGHVCNFTVYPGGQSTLAGEAWLLNAANFKGLTTPYLGGRKAFHTAGSYTWRDPRFTSGTVAKTGCQVGQINAPYLPSFLATAGDMGDRADAHLCWLAGIGGVAMYYIHHFSDITEAKVQEFVDAIAANPAVQVMLPRDLIQLIRTETDLDGDGLRFGRTVAPDESDYHLLPTSPCIGTGVDVGLTTDLDGNAVPGAVGYDIGPYSYMPGWTVSDGILPTSGQLTKSHALPIGTSRLTVFPGVASANQIAEAGE